MVQNLSCVLSCTANRPLQFFGIQRNFIDDQRRSLCNTKTTTTKKTGLLWKVTGQQMIVVILNKYFVAILDLSLSRKITHSSKRQIYC